LLDGMVGGITPMLSATATCYGKVIDATYSLHYGLRYEDMVNTARSLATKARFVTGRVAQVVTGPDTQTIVLADGTVIEARLVVLATGPNSADLFRSLGIERLMLSEHHSLTLGFDVQTASRRILVYYGEQAGDRIDYLTVFPIGDTMRANLFCYVDPGDPWVRSFKLQPKQALLQVMPSLERTIGPFEVVGKVQVRPNSIQRAENVCQSVGVVVIGDAYQSSCPAVGTGIGRILADVDVLNRLVPTWLATPGLGAGTVGQFYKDRAKCRFDAQALRDARHRRALCTETNWQWRAYRTQHYYRRRTLGIISRAIRREMPVLNGAMVGSQHIQKAGEDRVLTSLAWSWDAAKRAAAAALAFLTIG
jgi:2-polyprenyl-6-methoxyphenol hydroxylase-like FAD-dependent oxidoreductase